MRETDGTEKECTAAALVCCDGSSDPWLLWYDDRITGNLSLSRACGAACGIRAQEENDRLQAEKTHLGELPYIEKLAREELGMTGEGELPYAPGKRGNGN